MMYCTPVGLLVENNSGLNPRWIIHFALYLRTNTKLFIVHATCILPVIYFVSGYVVQKLRLSFFLGSTTWKYLKVGFLSVILAKD